MAKTNRAAACAFVEYGMRLKNLGLRESASGPGSSIQCTREAAAMILLCAKKYHVRSILDLGCGDWNWMRYVMLQPELVDVMYEGWDIHEGMVSNLNKKYGGDNIQF